MAQVRLQLAGEELERRMRTPAFAQRLERLPGGLEVARAPLGEGEAVDVLARADDRLVGEQGLEERDRFGREPAIITRSFARAMRYSKESATRRGGMPSTRSCMSAMRSVVSGWVRR
jgi:hypothetical protein